MTDYRLVMSLLLQDRSYRDIEAIAGCSHRTIAKAKKVCHDHGLTATSQVEALSGEEIDALFTDGRKTLADRACRYRGSGELVPPFRRPGTGPCVKRAGTVGGYSQ